MIADQAGTPVHPEWYSDEFRRLLRRAGLRKITLHDSRHTTLTLIAGVPVHVVAARLGHADPSITLRMYARVISDQLTEAADIFARVVAATI